MLKFALYNGDTGNLRTSDNHINFKWVNPDCNILFSVTKQGDAIVCHLASDKPGLRKLEQAVNEWCEFCFKLFGWCKMIIGVVERRSIGKLAEKCGFDCIASFGNKQIYIRRP